MGPGVDRAFFCVPSMNAALEWKSSIQPDGGEALNEAQGPHRDMGLKKARSKAATTKTG
jgi:hypothetical protein